MTLQDVINYARYRLGNYEKPYLWVDAEMVLYANNVIDQFCRETLIIEDSYTGSICNVALLENVLDYALSEKIIYVEAAKLLSSELLTLDVAPSTIWAADDTITGATSGVTCNVVEALTTKTYTVDQRTGEFTLGESLSNGTNAADQGDSYPILTDNSSTPNLLTKRTSAQMNTAWRTQTSGEPTKYILDYRDGYITVSPPPDQTYTLVLSVRRYPASSFTTTSMDSQTPEIPSQYHDALVTGICAQACLKAGENTYRPKDAAIFDGLFRTAISGAKKHNNLYASVETTAGPHRGFI